MFLAMNRFKVNEGKEDAFIAIWESRETYLDEVPGFVSFNLLRGATSEGITLFASHSLWQDKLSFEDWTRSEAFRKAHANAGASTTGIYAGHPQLELFETVL